MPAVIDMGRPARRPTSNPQPAFVLTARGHGYLDAAKGLPARPAAFGRQAHLYYQGYLLGIARSH